MMPLWGPQGGCQHPRLQMGKWGGNGTCRKPLVNDQGCRTGLKSRADCSASEPNVPNYGCSNPYCLPCMASIFWNMVPTKLNVLRKWTCVSPFLLIKDICPCHLQLLLSIQPPAGEVCLWSFNIQGFCAPTKCQALLEVLEKQKEEANPQIEREHLHMHIW